MKKRIISFLLALVLVLGLIPATATTANAASSLKTSTKAIDILSSFSICKNAVICGKVADEGRPALLLRTKSGGRRLISVPAGDLLPRIC